jgi:hypothetical protein
MLDGAQKELNEHNEALSHLLGTNVTTKQRAPILTVKTEDDEKEESDASSNKSAKVAKPKKKKKKTM